MRAFDVVDQPLPLPYAVSETDVAAEDWTAAIGGSLVSADSVATVRRHSTLRANAGVSSTRLVGRSVWNDRWLLVIPATSLNGNVEKAKSVFLDGLNGVPGVTDIKIGFKSYSRSGN